MLLFSLQINNINWEVDIILNIVGKSPKLPVERTRWFEAIFPKSRLQCQKPVSSTLGLNEDGNICKTPWDRARNWAGKLPERSCAWLWVKNSCGISVLWRDTHAADSENSLLWAGFTIQIQSLLVSVCGRLNSLWQ